MFRKPVPAMTSSPIYCSRTQTYLFFSWQRFAKKKRGRSGYENTYIPVSWLIRSWKKILAKVFTMPLSVELDYHVPSDIVS